MNQLPPAPSPGPPQVNRAAVNIQIRRIEQNLQTIIRSQTAAANKLAQLTRIQGAINKFKSDVGPMPKNITNKFNQFNSAITAARNGLGTAAGPALVQQAENKLAFVSTNTTKGNVFRTPKGVYIVGGKQGNTTGRIIPNAYYKVIEGRSGAWNWSVNNRAYNYNRATGNFRPKMAPALPPRPGPPPLPPKPDEYTNSLLTKYPNSVLNSMNKQKLLNVRRQFANRPDFNRPNVSNKIIAIQAAINKKVAAEEENVFSRL